MATCRDFPRVKEVRAYVTETTKSRDQGWGADCHDVGDKHWIDGYNLQIANPMTGYSQYAQSRKSWGINALGSFIVEVEADDGTTGVGVSIGGQPACYIVEKHLSRFVEGQDPRDIELMWDQMFRATLNYGRKGLPLQAVSALDIALWDLLGKIRKEPVYALLGGRTKDRLPVYCTTSRPDIAQRLGFVGAKYPCAYGPSNGDEGLMKNVQIHKEWRQKVGPTFPLSLDCYMALSVPYVSRLARALEPHGLKWIEEYLPPDDYRGYKEVRENLRGCNVMLTTGEHEYTKYGFKQLINSRCVDIIQPDVTWLGGITEAKKVIAMAAAEDILCIPHGSSVYSYHLQYAFPNCPVAEYINLSPEADRIVPYFGAVFEDEPLPKDGFIDLPDRPGFGVTLRKDGLFRPYERSNEEVSLQFKRNAERKPPIVATMPF